MEESFEFNIPTDDELSRFLEESEAKYDESEELHRRHHAIYHRLVQSLIDHDYEPLTPDTARFMFDKQALMVAILGRNLQDVLDERNITAEELLDLLDDEDRQDISSLAEIMLKEKHETERFFFLRIVLVADTWQQGMETARLGSPESTALYNDLVEQKKRLYADAIVDYELNPTDATVQTMLDFLPGEIDVEGDEMVTYLAETFAEYASNKSENERVVQDAYKLLGIDLDDDEVTLNLEKISAVNTIAWKAAMYSGTGIYQFENTIREIARELPLLNDEVQILIDYFAEMYHEDLTSPPDEAE